MLTATVILALMAVSMVSAADPYATSVESESTEEEKPGVEYYDEVYAVNAAGQLYAVTALSDTADWSAEQVLDDKLYNAKGVAICNNGVDEWGRWKWLYVADAGDEENAAAVYQYEIKRDQDNVGEIKLGEAEVVYGGDAEEEAPVDVVCFNKGLAIADAKKGVVFKKQADVQDKDADVNAWVAEDCEQVEGEGVSAIAVAGDDVYVAVNAEDEDVNGVWQQKADPKAECEDIEAVVKDKKGAYGVAVHNGNVLFSNNGKVVWDKKGNEWAKGYEAVAGVATAYDRGLLIADNAAGALYVNDGKNAAKIADVKDIQGVEYYAGLKWEAAVEEEEDDEDSAATLAIGAAVAVAAVAQL